MPTENMEEDQEDQEENDQDVSRIFYFNLFLCIYTAALHLNIIYDLCF